MTRQVKRKQIIMLHCLHIPDTARALTSCGRNYLVVSSLTITPPPPPKIGYRRVCVYITDLILSDNAESDGIDISINFL